MSGDFIGYPQFNKNMNKEKNQSIISAIILALILLGGTGLFFWKAGFFDKERITDFERGYYEGYEQGLSKDYWTGWEDCRRYFKERPELLIK